VLTLRNNDDTDRTALGYSRALDALDLRTPANTPATGGVKQ